MLASPASAASEPSFDAFANPGETVTVEFPFRVDGEQYTWNVPEGVTEVTLELAAGSGAETRRTEGPQSFGGPGGHLLASLPVDPTSTITLLVGQQGMYGQGGIVGGSPPGFSLTRGGGATIVAIGAEIVAVAGGGGAGYTCDSVGSLATCADGGAGGYSLTAGGPAGLDGSVSSDTTLAEASGGGASATGPGLSRDRIDLIVNQSGVVVSSFVRDAARQPSPDPARIEDGIIFAAVGGHGTIDRTAGGGSGYFGGGHGSDVSIVTLDSDGPATTRLAGGGGGGSGFLADGVELLELRDNVGDGFATITYTIPEPDVVDTLEPELTLGSATVQAGGQVTLSGTGFDPEREFPVIVNSDPVLLGTVITDGEGAFSEELTIPASVPAGEHVITVGDASIPITVLPAEAAAEGEDVLRDGAPIEFAGDDDAPAPAPELAASGADPLATSILSALALALLAAGAAAVRASRQPQPVRQR
ncbi:MAG: hypothetical protein ACXIUP_10670 [Microcella sp.]